MREPAFQCLLEIKSLEKAGLAGTGNMLGDMHVLIEDNSNVPCRRGWFDPFTRHIDVLVNFVGKAKATRLRKRQQQNN